MIYCETCKEFDYAILAWGGGRFVIIGEGQMIPALEHCTKCAPKIVPESGGKR